MRDGSIFVNYACSRENYPNTSQMIAQKLPNTNWGPTPAEALQALYEKFSVEVANTSQVAEEAYRLRYQVYCRERGYESSDTGLEIDEFDAQSRHIVIRHRLTGRVVATVRLVLFGSGVGKYSLPIQQFCTPGMLDGLPLDAAAEISRFAVAKELRGIAGASATPIHIGLMRGIIRVSQELGLTHWCAIMERSLLRLLRATAIHFHPIGPPVAHHGLRQPAYGVIGQIVSRVRSEQPAIWDFVNQDGLLTVG